MGKLIRYIVNSVLVFVLLTVIVTPLLLAGLAGQRTELGKIVAHAVNKIHPDLRRLQLIIEAPLSISESPRKYTVQPRDSLSKIAARFDTTVEKLIELNKDRYSSLVEDPGFIEVGWELVMPRKAEKQSKGVDLPSVAQRLLNRVREELEAMDIHYSVLPPSKPVKPYDVETARLEAIRLVNEERKRHGLQPLEIDPVLMEICQERAEQAARNFTHYGPNGEYLVLEVAKKHGLNKWVWENLGICPFATGVVGGWMASPPHRRGILTPSFHYVGVGLAWPSGAWALCMTE